MVWELKPINQTGDRCATLHIGSKTVGTSSLYVRRQEQLFLQFYSDFKNDFMITVMVYVKSLQKDFHEHKS